MWRPDPPLALQSRSPLGLPLVLDGLEEVCVEGAAVAAGLAFIITARPARDTPATSVMFAAPRAWLNERGRLFVSGLPAWDHGRKMVLVTAPRTETEALWALEEALRSKAVSLAIGAVESASLLATRRLDLAARAAGAAVLLLKTRPARDLSAARRRWRIGPSPSAAHPWDARASGEPRWRVSLERSRDGSTGAWIVEQDPETHRLRVVDRLADHGLDLGEKQDGRPVWRSA